MLPEHKLTEYRTVFAKWCKRFNVCSLQINVDHACLLIAGVSHMTTSWFLAPYGKQYFLNYSHCDMFCHSIHVPDVLRKVFPQFLDGISVAFRVDKVNGIHIITGIIPEYIGHGVDWCGFYPIEKGSFSFEALNILLR